MRAGRREPPRRQGCPGGPLARERQVALRGVALHGAGPAVELGGGLAGEVEVGAGSAEAGRLVVQPDEGYGRRGCAADQQSLSGAECSKRTHCL